MSEIDDEAHVPDPIRLKDLVREVPNSTLQGDGSARVLGVHHDSRRVQEGDLFVARRGAAHDGHAFINAAILNGAVALLVEAPVVKSIPQIIAKDVPSAMAYAAAAVYGHPAFTLDIVGITGTNGKTTTTHLVRAAIDGSFGMSLCGTIGTIGHIFAGRTIPAAHTTPESDELARVMAVMRRRGATHVAMEVSSIAIVQKRVDAVRFRVAAFTNLTQDHLDFHGSMEAYAAAKKELFTTMGPGLAVINTADPFGRELAAACKSKVIRVSEDVRADDVKLTPHGMELSLNVLGRKIAMKTRLVGQHNVENLCVAIGIVAALELEVDRAIAALEEERGAPGRLERCDGEGDDITVLVDYAHTPDALARVLDAVRAHGAGRVICVFGCGGDRDPLKREPMGRAVQERADVAIVTNDNPRTEDPQLIADATVKGMKDPIVELDRRKAIALAVSMAAAGDVVLIAGKGHEDYQIVGKAKTHFDDREEARRALAKRRG